MKYLFLSFYFIIVVLLHKTVLSLRADLVALRKTFFKFSTTIAFTWTFDVSNAYALEEILETASPKVTARAFMDVSIARKPSERVELGLYGDEAPGASKIFLSICRGESQYGEAVNYDGALVSKVVKDKEISIGKLAKGASQRQETWMDEVGKVRIRSVDLAERATHNDANSLTHTRGSISVKKGGGTFEFSIAPKDNPSLDKTNVVIGKVLAGMDVFDKVNSVPVSREDILGTKSGFSSLGKGFDGRAKIASVNRPLQKVAVIQCQVGETASMSSFMKF